jgi:hypothetical protein
MTALLHTAAVGAVPVRFFRSPLNDGKPDLPWCAMTDILFATCYDKATRAQLAMTISRDHRERIRSIEHEKARLVIGAYSLASDILGAAVRRRVAHRSLLLDLQEASMEAAGNMLAGRDPADAAAYLIASGRRWPTVEAL